MLKILLKLRGQIHMIAFAGLFVAAYMGFPYTGCSYLKLGFLRLICPFGFIEVALASHSIPWNLVPGLCVLIVLMVIFGRAYCSWICPASYAGTKIKNSLVGILPNKLSRSIPRTLKRLQNRLGTRINAGKGDVLAIALGIALGILIFGYPVYSIFCPIGVLSRNIIEFVVHSKIGLQPHIELRYDIFFLLIPLFIAFFFRWGWKCVCPVGTLRGAISSANRTLEPYTDPDTCIHCHRCTRNCPAGIDIENNKLDTFKCSKCLECVSQCPKNSVDIKRFI